jgi:hypothetical protein
MRTSYRNASLKYRVRLSNEYSTKNGNGSPGNLASCTDVPGTSTDFVRKKT